MSTDPNVWPGTIAEAGARFRDGSLSVEALTRYFLEGISARQPQLNAFITVTDDLALETAAAWDTELKAGMDRGPLLGVPVVIKDDTDVAGYRVTVGSALYRENVSNDDANVVKRLKAAGAVILGKTNMNEFAAGGKGGYNPHFGDTRNPWSPDHEPGGSSSGTAAAVAAHLCLGGTGTDAGGSVRGPAARCGVVGEVAVRMKVRPKPRIVPDDLRRGDSGMTAQHGHKECGSGAFDSDHENGFFV